MTSDHITGGAAQKLCRMQRILAKVSQVLQEVMTDFLERELVFPSLYFLLHSFLTAPKLASVLFPADGRRRPLTLPDPGTVGPGSRTRLPGFKSYLAL